MKLVHRDIEQQFNFDQSSSWQFVIESANYFYETLQGLYAQVLGDEGLFVLSDANSQLKVDGNVFILFEPFTLNPNTSRRVSTKLLSNLRTIAFSEQYLNDTNELLSAINKYATELFQGLNYQFDITAGDDFAVDDLLKALKPQIELQGDTLPERLIDYFAVLRDLCESKLFVLVNFSSYLSQSEMAALISQIAYDGHSVIFVERQLVQLDIPQIIITPEMCEL